MTGTTIYRKTLLPIQAILLLTIARWQLTVSPFIGTTSMGLAPTSRALSSTTMSSMGNQATGS